MNPQENVKIGTRPSRTIFFLINALSFKNSHFNNRCKNEIERNIKKYAVDFVKPFSAKSIF